MRSQADMNQEMVEFFAYLQSPIAHQESGGRVTSGAVFNDNGWRVAMVVGSKAIVFAPGWGRGAARRMRETVRGKIAAMTAEERAKIKPDEILAVFDDMETSCKHAMRLQAAGATPADLEREPGHA